MQRVVRREQNTFLYMSSLYDERNDVGRRYNDYDDDPLGFGRRSYDCECTRQDEGSIRGCGENAGTARLVERETGKKKKHNFYA